MSLERTIERFEYSDSCEDRSIVLLVGGLTLVVGMISVGSFYNIDLTFLEAILFASTVAAYFSREKDQRGSLVQALRHLTNV